MKQRGFILPSFFLSPTGMLTATVAVLTLTNFITYKLWRSEVEEYAQFKSEVVATQNALAAEAERRRIASEQATRDAAEGWKGAVDYWKSRAGGIVTVRVPVGCEGGMRAVLGTAPGAGHASAEPAPSTVVDAAQCETLLNNAVLDAAQVEHLRAAWHAQVKASMK